MIKFNLNDDNGVYHLDSNDGHKRYYFEDGSYFYLFISSFGFKTEGSKIIELKYDGVLYLWREEEI